MDDRDTCKKHRMDIMDDYLASIGQQRKPIPRDGSSLFRAVSEQLFSTQAHQVEVRQQCVAHMKRNKEEFENFVDIPFDDYLNRMSNTKEWGDQLEISALSQLYKCDFYIYEKPGQDAKNVTENGSDLKIYLCHSGQKHYDSVYPSKYFTVFGICQSIVNSILLTNVLGVNKEDEKKLVQTFRMLSSPEKEVQNDKKNKNLVENFPLPSLYEPSIGTIDELVPIEMQMGLAYQLPFSLNFIRSLDPSDCRNIDYDFWIAIKRRQQYIDSSIAEGLQYCIGDRCLICLNIYSKPLVGHVQEVSPNNGPITAFLEALGGMHTVAVKNVKPLEARDNACCNDYWNSRWRRRPNEGNWNRSRNYQKFSKNFQKNSDKFLSSSFRNGNRRYEDDAFQRRKSKENNAAGSNNRKHNKLFSERSESGKNLTSEDIRNRTKSSGKSYGSHKNYRQSPTCSTDLSSSQIVRQLSIAPDSCTDDSWQQSAGDGSEVTIAIPPFPGSSFEWDNWSTVSTYGPHVGEEIPNVASQDLPENYISPDGKFWKQDGQFYASHRLDKRETDNENCADQNVEIVPNCDVSNSTAPIKSRDEENDVNYQSLTHDSLVEDSSEDVSTFRQPSEIFPSSSDTFVQPSESYVAYGAPQEPTHSTGPPAALPQTRTMCAPYSGTITVLDCDGKEVVLVDDKNPFQYFYNLGVEYYRQINAGNPRPVPVVYGASVPLNAYGSPHLVHPHHMGYYSTPGTPQFVSPMPPSGYSLSMPHFSSMVSPPQGGAMHVPSGPFLVHIPPAPQLPAPSTIANNVSDNMTDHVDNNGAGITTVSSREISQDSNGSQIRPTPPNYPGLVPGVPLYAGPPLCYQMGDSGAVPRPQFCPTVQPQLRCPFLG